MNVTNLESNDGIMNKNNNNYHLNLLYQSFLEWIYAYKEKYESSTKNEKISAFDAVLDFS